MNIIDLYNELVDSLDDFKSLLKKPSMRSPEIVQQLMLLTVELVKAIQFSSHGQEDKIPSHLTDNIEESRAALKKRLDTLENPGSTCSGGNIRDLYTELADSLDNFKLLFSEPCSSRPEVAQRLLVITSELVKALEYNRRGEIQYVPSSLTDNIETSRITLKQWLDKLTTESGDHYVTEPLADEARRVSGEFERQQAQTTSYFS